jgi:hypothetical protein
VSISKAIDPKRVGISKSLVTSTALCGRKGWFSEKIRLEDGSRLPFIAPERVAFGSALDESILIIAEALRANQSWNEKDVVDQGLFAARSRQTEEGIDWEIFHAQLEAAVKIFVYDVIEPELVTFRDVYLQGLDGESLKVEGLIGTPDFIFRKWNGEVGATMVLDLKASARSKSAKDLRSAEMAFYSYLWSRYSAGELPGIGYLTYVRTKRPTYQLITGKATGEHLLLAEQYLAATRSVVGRDSVEEVAFTTSFCGSCEWRKPNPLVGFDGCSVGRLVASDEKEAE